MRWAVALLGVVIAVAGCRRGAAVDTEPVIVEADRFPHDRHRDLPCTECHDAAQVAAGVVELPGADDHAPCDRGQCHQEAFTAPPGDLCRICHLVVDVTGAASPEMTPYPRTGGWQVMPARFSHQLHLDLPRIEAAVGFHVACRDCHAREAADATTAAGHAECARCHAVEAGLPRAPTMADCTGCHQVDARAIRRDRRLIAGDLHFDHRNHRADARGAPIRCATCHGETEAATGRDDHPPPRIASCVACHDDSARVPSSMRMRACQTCHATLSETIGKLAPRSHLPATERPIDHTLAFRRDHGEDAARDPGRCANCHTQMSGNPRAACDECHQTMRPADHNVLFRDSDHGTAASTDPERCATCHVVDYCVACHSQRPRSHLFDWERSHGMRARFNARACFVCHDPGPASSGNAAATTCLQAGCHARGP